MGGPPKPPAHVGPATVASTNSGNQVSAKAGIEVAAKALQQALLQLPMGGEEHTKLLKIVKDLSGMMADSAPDPHAQMQNLVAMARKASQGGAPQGLSNVMPAMAPPPAPAGAGAEAA